MRSASVGSLLKRLASLHGFKGLAVNPDREELHRRQSPKWIFQL